MKHGGIVLSDDMASKLRLNGFTANQIRALRLAMGNSAVDVTALAYSNGIERSFEEYGIEGVKMNIMYLLTNLRGWNGQEAREAKAILRTIK